MRKQLFNEFLNFFWLRPENALLLSIRADSIQKVIREMDPSKRSLDVSCGDGVFSFITFGGRLSSKTDMFRSIDSSQSIRVGNHDVFNHFDDSYFVEVTKEPEKFYKVGSDWKRALLNKADKLGAYQNLFEHDNNLSLPFEAEEMQFIYSNSAYWVEKFKFHLEDLVRVTEPGGYIVLEMKNKNIINHTSSNYAPFMGERFHQIIDAGRLSTWKGLKSQDEILSILRSINGVEIEQIEPIYGGLLAKMWDIGLRPLFNPLVKMANSLEVQNRTTIKEEWCKIIYEMFSEVIESYIPTIKDSIEDLYIIRKK